MTFNLSQFAGAFAGVVAVGGAAFLLAAARPDPATLDVQRINVREPNGTLRMVISSAAQAPGIIIDGHEQPHPSRRSAGLLFYNDEGTENGGLIFDGRKDAQGVHSGGSLTFDRYKQDQVVQLIGQEDGAERYAGLQVNDQPDKPMDFAAIARAGSLNGPAQRAAFRAAYAGGTPRAFLGRARDGASEMVLKDAMGAARLKLSVAANGDAVIQFMDKAGKVQRTLR